MPGSSEIVGERELVSRAARGDAASVKAIYDAQVQYLAAVCRRYISDEDDVKDVLQESFVRIFNSLRKFQWRGEGSLRAWMKRIVVNESLMSLRRHSAFPTTPLPDNALEGVADEAPGIDGVPMQVIQRMIRSLPVGYRTVFNLYAIEGHSHKEISSLLGISENTSFSQYSRARARLAELIREYRKNGE